MLLAALVAGMLIDYRGPTHAQALHAGPPPITASSQHFLARCIICAPVSRCNLIYCLTERMGAIGSYLLNRALGAAEQRANRSQVSAAKFWSARYYFFDRWGKTLHKCLAYTSASQTSTAVVTALGDFTEDHYWMCVQKPPMSYFGLTHIPRCCI